MVMQQSENVHFVSALPVFIDQDYQRAINDKTGTVRSEARVLQYKQKFGQYADQDFINECKQWNWDLFIRLIKEEFPEIQFVFVGENEIVTNESKKDGWPAVWRLTERMLGHCSGDTYPANFEGVEFYPKELRDKMHRYCKGATSCGNPNQRQVQSTVLANLFPKHIYNKTIRVETGKVMPTNFKVERWMVMSKQYRCQNLPAQ